MPRNGTGTMSVTNSFSANTTIESSKVNANFTDIASEITGSLPRDGQASMTGQLKSSSGTAAAPGATFSSDATTGLYLISAGKIGIAAGGVKVGEIDSGGVRTSASVKYDAFPSGTALLFYQNTAPTGWTIVTSSINDKALRVVSGSGSGGGTGGATGGTTAFTSVFTGRTISQANLPNYTLPDTFAVASGGAHSHTIPIIYYSLISGGSGSAVCLMHPASGLSSGTVNETTDTEAAHTHSLTGSVTSGGSGTAMDFAVAYASVIIATKD